MTSSARTESPERFFIPETLITEPMGRIATLDQIPPQGQGPLRCTVGDTPIGLFRVEDEIIAWRDVCPHEAASVCLGPVVGTRLQTQVYEYKYGRHHEILRCPWHGWEFDLISGEHIAEGSGARLRRYPIEIREGVIYDASGKGAPLARELRIEKVIEVGQVLEIDLVDSTGMVLPAWQPGSHLEVRLPSGLVRHYSLCGDDRDRSRYRIAVRLEPAGKGGSAELHELALQGAALHVNSVRNNFPLRYARDYLFLAAGIGITPILTMVRAATRRNSNYRAVYLGKETSSMPLLAEFASFPETTIFTTTTDGRPDINSLIADSSEDTAIYCCGPEGFVEAVKEAAASAGSNLVVYSEQFMMSKPIEKPKNPFPFDVSLARTGGTVHVAADESVLEALRRGGVERPSSCESGWCGSCETPVVSGTPIHYDTVLGGVEHESNDTMMICVSRSDGYLTLDI